MKPTFIAYAGSTFTIEWYTDDRGKSEALKYYDDLSPDRKKKLFIQLRILGDIGKIFNEEKFRYEGDQLYAIKTSPDRFFCLWIKNYHHQCI